LDASLHRVMHAEAHVDQVSELMAEAALPRTADLDWASVNRDADLEAPTGGGRHQHALPALVLP
jgi:hypothetical protein